MIYANPGEAGSVVSFEKRYGNYIGGEFVAPLSGQYFSNTSPVDGSVIAEFPRSNAADIDKALDAAHAAADAWGRTSVQERSHILLKIADRIEANLELLAVAETWDNGKAVRETLNADVPLAADHFRYFAGCIRAQEGSTAEINDGTVAYHFHEPLGVVGQIIPWNFPLQMAAWKLAPALAAAESVPEGVAEDLGEDVVQIGEALALTEGIAAPAAVDPGVAEPVIGRPLLVVGQNRIGLGNLLELGHGLFRAAVPVRVMDHRQLAIGRFQAGGVDRPLDAQNFVIVTRHRASVLITSPAARPEPLRALEKAVSRLTWGPERLMQVS